MSRGVAGPGVPRCGVPRRRNGDGERVDYGEGEPCERPAGWGTPNAGVPGTPCKLHGGSLPNNVSAATRRRVELECTALLAEHDVTPVTDSVAELEVLAGEVLAWRDLLRQRLGELHPEDWRYTGKVGEELHTTVALYERSLDKAERILTSMSKLGIAGRKVQLEEARFDLMANLVELTLADLGVDAADRDVRAVLHRHATALEAASEEHF